MTEKHLGDGLGMRFDSASNGANLVSEAWDWMKEHPKTTAAIGAGVAATALFFSRGSIAGFLKGGAEAELPSALLKAESRPGTVARMFDDMVTSGRYSVEGKGPFFVMKPVESLATKVELPSTLLRADSQPGTVAHMLDQLVANGDYRMVRNGASFVMEPVGAPNASMIAVAEAKIAGAMHS